MTLEIKKEMKARKPRFKRQDAHKQSKKNQNWRKPRGYQSKVRLSKRGYGVMVKSGYRTPVSLRGVSLDGLKRVNVSCVSDLKKIDVKNECALISSSVGIRKKVILLDEAVKLNVVVANVKDIAEFMKSVKEKQLKKKEVKQKRDSKREAKEKELKEKKEEKKSIESKIEDPEEKKKTEKKEKDKVLTQKQ